MWDGTITSYLVLQPNVPLSLGMFFAWFLFKRKSTSGGREWEFKCERLRITCSLGKHYPSVFWTIRSKKWMAHIVVGAGEEDDMEERERRREE